MYVTFQISRLVVVYKANTEKARYHNRCSYRWLGVAGYKYSKSVNNKKTPHYDTAKPVLSGHLKLLKP